MFASRIAQSHVAIHLVKRFIGKTVCSRKMHTKMLRLISARPQLVLVLWQGLWEACLHYKPLHSTSPHCYYARLRIHLHSSAACVILNSEASHDHCAECVLQTLLSHNGVRRRMLVMLYKNSSDRLVTISDICLHSLNESISDWTVPLNTANHNLTHSFCSFNNNNNKSLLYYLYLFYMVSSYLYKLHFSLLLWNKYFLYYIFIFYIYIFKP